MRSRFFAIFIIVVSNSPPTANCIYPLNPSEGSPISSLISTIFLEMANHLPSCSNAGNGTLRLPGMWPLRIPCRGSGADPANLSEPLASTTASLLLFTFSSIDCRSLTRFGCKHNHFLSDSFLATFEGSCILTTCSCSVHTSVC